MHASYEIWCYDEKPKPPDEETQRFLYVRATPVPWLERPVEAGTREHKAGYEAEYAPDWSVTTVYAPLTIDDLFVQFANLFGNGPIDLSEEEAAEKVLSWVEGYGVLGRNETYPREDGEMDSGRFDDREDVLMFVRLAVEAGRTLRLFSAATEPGGPNVKKLRALGVEGHSPQRMKERAMAEVVDIVDRHLESETFTRLYRGRDDGKLFKGPGFHSLLGALWLQMSNLLTVPEEDVKRCLWCGDVISFESGEPPPSHAPRGTRGKHKTHRNRKFCKEKHGVRDQCKNRYNDHLRKKLAARAAEDAKGGLHMRDARPQEWDGLTEAQKGIYDLALRRTKKAR